MDDDLMPGVHPRSINAEDEPMTPVSYEAGLIVLSFVVSVIGCITTVELLQRRTSTKGLYNWYLLLASAATMGGIGVWGMHFVGNRAVVLAHGARERQIMYNPTYTAISFFMPIVVLFCAFYVLGVRRRTHLHLAGVAILTGAAICGMHYLGQYGIANYQCSYQVGNVVGAAIIAVAASFIALSLFFRLRDTWTDSWWKRTFCGVILAMAVSGMHWTATVGTSYEWKNNDTIRGSSRTQTSIIAATLSIGACVILLVAAIIRGRKIRTTRIRAQRLTLACAYFDEHGQLMVTQDGLLPSEKITNHYVEKTFGDDELSRSHETFLWIFRASHKWELLKNLIPGMKEYIETDTIARKFGPNQMAENLADDFSDSCVNFAPIFKQLFCVAAQALANHMHEPLERIGVLFEEPLDTGTVFGPPAKHGLRGLSINPYNTDMESSSAFPRGKYLFLNRQLSRIEASKFAALGHRFAGVEQIADSLAKSIQVNRDNMLHRLERMRKQTSTDHLPPPGVHLACFMLRPSMQQSFDILVPTADQDQLPLAPVRSTDLSRKEMDQLKRFDEWTVSEMMRVLRTLKGSGLMEDVRWPLHDAFVQLGNLIGEPENMTQAKFTASEIHVPCRKTTEDGPTTCTLLVVRVLRNIHAPTTKKDFTWVPLSFFSAQQTIQRCDSNDTSFATQARKEFGHLSVGGCNKPKGSHSIRLHRRSSSAGSNNNRMESPRSHTFRFPSMSPFRAPRRSDETTIVNPDQAKSISEESDVEMSGGASTESDSAADKNSFLPQIQQLNLPFGKDKGNWVMEVFALFKLGAVGWASVRSDRWEWDINVENTFEVGHKESQTGNGTTTQSF